MLGAFLLLFQSAPTPPRPAAPAPREHPQLTVLVVVDQMRPDYFTRFGAQFTGGFRRILDTGTLYLAGRQDHAMTETAPGHSTLLSGRNPAATGILSNDNGVNDSTYPIVGGGTGDAASPLRFQGTTLFDWMLARDPATRVFSVSRKDRGAILPVGRAKTDVYWWTGGRWGTSRYYRDTLPGWLQRYNTRPGWRQFLGAAWRPLLPDSAYPERDSVPWEHRGRDFTFPHLAPADSATMSWRIIYYPWMDSLTLDVALEGARQAGLGQRADGTDLLVVSLSTTDRMGHDFGPDSREMHDHLLRLDRWLGWFADSLGRLVPAERTLWVLSADHGVQSWAEHTRDAGGRAGRVSFRPMVDTLRRELRARWHTDFSLAEEDGLIYGDVAAMRDRGIDVGALAARLASAAHRYEGVWNVYTPRTLARAPRTAPEAGYWRRAIPPGQGWLIAASIRPGYVWGHTDHGSTNLLDRAVPIAFWGWHVRPARPAREARTVDIAPTLAALLGLAPTQAVEGRPLPELVRARR